MNRSVGAALTLTHIRLAGSSGAEGGAQISISSLIDSRSFSFLPRCRSHSAPVRPASASTKLCVVFDNRSFDYATLDGVDVAQIGVTVKLHRFIHFCYFTLVFFFTDCNVILKIEKV